MSVEKIKLMELDLDIDLMLKKASESREAVDKLKATVSEMGKAFKNNQKDISSTIELMKMLEDAGESNTKEYKELETSLNSLKATQKEYSKQIEISQSELRKEQKEYSALKRQVDVVNKTMDESLGVIRTTDGSIDQLTQALANNRKIYRSLPEDIRENSVAGKELKKVIDEQDAAYKELNTSIGVNQVNVGDYRGQLEDLFTSLKAGQPVIPALVTAFKGLYAQFIALAMNPIGATIAALAGIVAVTKMWYDYNLEMSKSTQLVQQFTGLAGQELESLTVKTRELAEVSGESEKAILNAVTATAKAYGVSYEEAFDKVQNGWIRGGKAADDYFDNTAEYASQFDNAGYSADEFFSILEAGAKNGVYKDKLTDTIKEIDLRLGEMPKSASDALTNAFGQGFTDKITKGLNDGTLTTKKAFESIIQEADKFELNMQQKKTLVADVMGAAGEDAGGFEKAIEAINDGLVNTYRELTEVEKAQQLEIESTQLLEEKWASLFNASGGTFEMLKAEGKAWLNGVLIKLIDGAISFANGFVEVYNSSMLLRLGINSVGAAVKNLGVIFGSSLKLIWNGLTTTGNLLKAVLTFDLDGVKSALSKGFGEVGVIATAGAKQIMDNTTEAFKNTRVGSLQAMTFNTGSFTQAIEENTEKTKLNTLATEKNEKAKKKKAKSSNDAKKAEEQYSKELEKQLKTLQEIADSKEKFALNELENDIKNREERLKLEDKFTQEVYNANLQLFNDKHELKLKEIDEEKRLNLQKIENERKAEEDRINTLKVSQAQKDEFLKSVNEKAKADQDLVNQSYNQKMIENDNQLNVSRKENQDKWDAQEREKQKLQDELELQAKLLKIETESQNEYAKKLEVENLQYENDKVLLEQRRLNDEISLQEYMLRKEMLEMQHGNNIKSIEQSVNEFKIQQRSETLGMAAGLFNQESALGKAFYTAQILNDTYQKAAQSFNQGRVFASNPLTAALAPNAFIQGALTIASGLAQVKKLVAPKLKFEDGGLLVGPSHSNGGIPFTINGQSGFEAEGGEYIVNKNSTKKFLPLLQAINGTYKGKHTQPNMFQNGGLITTQNQITNSIDYDLLATKIADANRYLPSPKVAITEINRAQNNYAKVESNANF